MSKGHKYRLAALIVLMTLLWSANFIVAKFALREIPPLLTAGLRTIIAGVVMIPVYRWYTQHGEPARWGRRDLPRLLTLGIVGVGFNQVFFVLGLSRTSVAHAAIIIGVTPVIVLMLAAAVGQERLRRAKLIGMAVAIGGVALLQAASLHDPHATLLGDALLLAGTSLFAAFTVGGKTAAHRLGSVTVNAFAYAGSAVALIPVTVWAGRGFDYAAVSWLAWSSLLYMALFASVLCYLIYYYALQHIPASRISTFSYVQPVLATLLAIPLLGEQPTQGLLAGGALVFFGVVMAERA